MDIREVIHDYYNELTKACKTGSLDVSKLNFADDVNMYGPGEHFAGREMVEKMFQGFTSLLSSCEIKKQYFDADSACTYIIFTSKDGKHSIPTAEIITVKNGKVQRMDVIFDNKQWEKFLPS